MPANKIIFKTVLSLSLLALFITAYFIIPEKSEFLTCRFKQLTGYSCPTCGLTRSFHAFSHLHFKEAFGFHLFGPFLYTALLLCLIKFLYELTTGKEIKTVISVKGYKIIAVIFISILMIYWIIRFIIELQ